jgi:hypothetical protein
MSATEEIHERAHEEPGQIAVERHKSDLMLRLVSVASEMSAVDKRGWNEKQKYAFARADDVVGDIRQKLLERKVLVLAYEHHTEERMRQTAGGSESAVTTVHLVFLLIAADTGERIELMWPGRGEDPMDKGISKALTNALKTFLRQQFLLPWGNDDPEADESTDERAAGHGNTVNFASRISGSGLSDAKLNEILVGAGLSAAQSPFRVFMSIPHEKAEIVEKLIAGAKS